MSGNMTVDVRAVAELASVQRAVGAGLAGSDLRGLGLDEDELQGSRTAASLARALTAIDAALSAVAARVEDLGRRTALGATAIDETELATTDSLRRGPR
ncbi:hypothetical protein ACXVUM_12965 [Williamsia sp. SKLECPSW1]